jgi:uridine phosphorylase
MQAEYPILEYDPAREAIIEPSRVITPQDVPEHCVLCFFQEVITRLVTEGRSRVIATCTSEMGEHPLYELAVEGKRLAVIHPGVGAPLAVGLVEEVIALGCRKFIACGGAGVLNRETSVGHIIIPSVAIRDEGTSYHYLPPGREIGADPAAIEATVDTLRRHNVPFVLGKTWTTDAFYRETPDKVRLRRSEGCLTVEMEAAAFFAVAAFRQVPFAQLLYGGDDVSGADWDSRHWQTRGDIRESLFWMAAEACLAL